MMSSFSRRCQPEALLDPDFAAVADHAKLVENLPLNEAQCTPVAVERSEFAVVTL
jgi:hypothetical protein